MQRPFFFSLAKLYVSAALSPGKESRAERTKGWEGTRISLRFREEKNIVSQLGMEPRIDYTVVAKLTTICSLRY